MAFTKSLILTAALCLLLAPPTIAARTPTGSLWNICKTTTNPSVCYNTIQLQAGNEVDKYKALEIEVAETQKQVLQTVANVASEFLKSGNDKSLSDSILVCKDQYSTIVNDVDATVALVSQRNINEARFKFSGVLSLQQACNEEFMDTVSPFKADAQAIYDLAGNSLDIMKAIEDEERLAKGSKA